MLSWSKTRKQCPFSIHNLWNERYIFLERFSRAYRKPSQNAPYRYPTVDAMGRDIVGDSECDALQK